MEVGGKENTMSRVMDSILEQLFYGNINVSEYFSPDKDSLFKDEKMTYRENEKKFHDRLPPDLCKEYEELITEAVDFVAMENCHASNYSSCLLQLCRRLNSPSPSYRLS